MRVTFEKSSHTVKEMSNVKCLPRFQEISFNVIFGINIDVNFTHKARLVAGGHRTAPPN